jgi:hypothetical protein
MNLSKLLTKTGTINTAIVKQKKFLESHEYKYILENSSELNIFKNISFSERFWFVFDKMELSYCKVCNKPFIYFKHSQNRHSLCNHKQSTNNYIGVNKVATNNRKNNLNQLLKSKTSFLLNEKEFKDILDKLIEKDINYTFIISKEHMNFYHDLILKTNNIIPYQFDNNFEISQRFYLCYNNLKSIPVCKYCKKIVKYINRMVGYQENCRDCEGIKIQEWRIKDNEKRILENFNYDKYEIVSLPTLNYKEPLIIKCKSCNHISKIYLINGKLKNLKNLLLCEKCEKQFNYKEYGVFEFCKSLVNDDDKILKNSRKIIPPLELDIFIPEKNIAIEFDGLYWHSDENSKDRHIYKTELCEEKNIHLIHIFENEWDYKQDIVKSRLKNLLGLSENKLYARQCEIREIDSKTSKEFQEENHIQGACGAKIHLGLFYKEELVSLMTFSKPRFDKKRDWELVRFCNKINYSVVGAASKLLKYFERNYNPKNIVSYADRRWTPNFNNNLYEKLGFKLDHISRPDYWYWKNGKILESRIKYQKHKQKNILEKFDPNKTEVENMVDNEYSRIFDCGNLVYIKEI